MIELTLTGQQAMMLYDVLASPGMSAILVELRSVLRSKIAKKIGNDEHEGVSLHVRGSLMSSFDSWMKQQKEKITVPEQEVTKQQDDPDFIVVPTDEKERVYPKHSNVRRQKKT